MISNKALIGVLGVTAVSAAAAWMLLPKDSKIRKMIIDRARQVGGIFKQQVNDVVNVATERTRSGPGRQG